MRALVAGYGSVGRRHARNLRSLGAEVWAFDPDPAARADASEERGTFSSWDEALAGGPWDLALVTTPTHLHLTHARALLPAARAVFVEKPLSNTLDGVEALCGTARELGCSTMVGCNMRFYPTLRRAREILASGELGRVLYARLRFGQFLPDWRPGRDYRASYSARAEQGGGIVLDDIHELDLALHLFGRSDEFVAMGGKLSSLDLDVEDYACVTLRTRTGAVVNVSMDYLHPLYQRQLEVVAEGGALRWDEAENTLWLCRRGESGWSADLELGNYDWNGIYVAEIEHLLACLRDGSPPMNGFDEARETLALALKVRAGLHAGAPARA